MMLDGKVGDSVYFPDEEDAFDAPLLLVESRSSGGARKLLEKCRNGLDDIRSSLHTSSAWGLQTLGESFSGSLSESFGSSVHSARDDPSCSTKNSSDPSRPSAKVDRKLMKTWGNDSASSFASFVEDSGDSSGSFAGTDEDTAQASAYGDNGGGGFAERRSFSTFVLGELEDSDSSDSENGLLEGGASTGILQLTFNVGGGCTLSNLESTRPDDSSNTTATSPKVPPRSSSSSSSCNNNIPGNQQRPRKDSNISHARINNFPVDASPDRRLRRSKSNDIVLPSRKSQLSDNSEKDGRKLRRSSSADKIIGGRKATRRRGSSDKTNIKSGREGLKASSIDRRPRSPSADKIELDRRSIHSDGKPRSRRSSTGGKLTVRTTVENKDHGGSDNEPDKDDLEMTGGRRRSCQNSRPRRRAEVARVLQSASSFNEKVTDRPVRRLPARAASSRCLMSSRSEHLLGSRLSAREESSSPFHEENTERPVRRLPVRAASSRNLIPSRNEHLRGGPRLSSREESSSPFHEQTAERPVRRLPARAASSRNLMSSRSEHLRGGPLLSSREECDDHSKPIRVAPQRAGWLQRAQSLRTVVDPAGSSARLYAPEVDNLRSSCSEATCTDNSGANARQTLSKTG